METRQMTPFFPSTFFALIVCNIHFYIWNNQNPFWCGPRFGPFWSVKCLNFGQNLLIRTTHHTFFESRHPEVTKNPCYVLSPECSQIKVCSWTICKHSPNKWKFCDYWANDKNNHIYFWVCIEVYISSRVLLWSTLLKR